MRRMGLTDMTERDMAITLCSWNVNRAGKLEDHLIMF